MHVAASARAAALAVPRPFVILFVYMLCAVLRAPIMPPSEAENACLGLLDFLAAVLGRRHRVAIPCASDNVPVPALRVALLLNGEPGSILRVCRWLGPRDRHLIPEAEEEFLPEQQA